MALNKTFLTADWRKLALANYEIDKDLLIKHLPAHTELDDWQGKYLVSLVGFMFVNVKLLGIKVPFHNNFEEVNLRFYVKYKEGNFWKRGVVFIKEIVPKPAITFVANTLYKENYQTLPMKHEWVNEIDHLKVTYEWKNKKWNHFSVITHPQAVDISKNSIEEFITEHYWGYTKINSQQSSEYGVEHPSWQCYPIQDYKIDVDFGLNYGDEFSFLNDTTPQSVLLAEGSAIKVLKGKKIY